MVEEVDFQGVCAEALFTECSPILNARYTSSHVMVVTPLGDRHWPPRSVDKNIETQMGCPGQVAQLVGLWS